MSLQLAANHLSSQGRGPDSTLVHMSPGEVKSLQQIAMAHGGSLTINPQTGLPEAGFLSSILPMLAGAGLSMIPGVGPLMAAGIVGGGMTAATGSLKKGIMAGLGAYGGAGLGGGLMGAGTAAAQQGAIAGLGEGASQAAMNTAAAQATQNALANPISTMGQGISGLTETAGREAFMSSMGGGKGLLTSGGAALAPMLANMGQQKYQPPAGSTSTVQPYQYSANPITPSPQPNVPGYGDLGRDFGRQNRYFDHKFTQVNPQPASIAPITTMPIINDVGGGMASGGPVEDMSISNVYDMQNARGGVSDMGIDNSTGMQRMAGGGITGNGELNLNIPLNFGGGGGGDFGGGFNQGPLDLGQNRTGFGQSAGNVYQPAGSGVSSSPPGFLAPKPSSTVGLTENPFNLGTQLASRLGSANQNPFAAQPTPEMMAAQRGESLVNPVISQISQADLQRLAEAGQARAYEQYLSGFGKNTPTYESQVARASAGGQTFPISREKYEQQVANAVPMTRQEYDRMMQQTNMGSAPLAHVLQPGTVQYDNYMKNRGPSNQFERFADGGIAAGGISHLGDYSDGGRLLRGPGDGVSDSIPAMIGAKQPARLADGEFVVPARIVSELGNGSTEAGARKLYAMMDRIQKNRRKTVGKGKVAVNSRSDKLLPA